MGNRSFRDVQSTPPSNYLLLMKTNIFLAVK